MTNDERWDPPEDGELRVRKRDDGVELALGDVRTVLTREEAIAVGGAILERAGVTLWSVPVRITRKGSSE